MGWTSALRKHKEVIRPIFLGPPAFVTYKVDWARLVSLDFETYYDTDYTLSKLSTSEYVRDPRFEVLMCGIKVGTRPTRIVPGNKVARELAKIPWQTHSLLCHNMHFDGFILGDRFNIHPKNLFCSLSMARGLHSNDIGVGLDEVSVFYGGAGKLVGGVEGMKGLHFKDLFKNKPLWASSSAYCMNDVDEMLRVFKLMLPKMPADEVDLIHLINRMFCEPVLKVDLPRVKKELARELAEREALLLDVVNPTVYESVIGTILKTGAERALEGKERRLLAARRIVGSNGKFAELLRAEGIDPPVKISPAWTKRSPEERDRTESTDKWAFAFAKDDSKFINLPDDVERLGVGLNLAKVADVKRLAARQTRLRLLVDARLAVKSTTNITRAERFLAAGKDGASLPVGYAYYRAHTGRLGGNNKMNMQNLTRGGELRQSILAPPGYLIGVQDSGQIEARVNAWMWGQEDLLAAFQAADAGTDRDAYCKFGDEIYGRTITKADATERFVGKVCILGLGYQMGAPRLQMTLAKGALGGPPIYFELPHCVSVVSAYRRKNHRIANGWSICKSIIEDMAAGRSGSHGPITWEKESVWLPNGMRLKYPGLSMHSNAEGWDEWTYLAKDQTKKIYGGLLCENIIQALARIIVMWQMLQIDKFARVVMTTHDEVAAIFKKPQAEPMMRRMHKIMCTPPAWCPDLPLSSEGKCAPEYSK